MILKNREIHNYTEIEEIINKADICHIGLVDGDKPYVLPFNFAYQNRVIFLHTAPEGKKNDVIEKNNNICISFDIDTKLSFRNEEMACSYSMKYRSVVLSGKAMLINDYDEKVRVMNLIMVKYTGKEFTYNAPAINNIKIYKVEIEEITGKKFGY